MVTSFLLSNDLSVLEEVELDERKCFPFASVVKNQNRAEAVNIQSGNVTVTPPAPITTTKTKQSIHSEEGSLC